MGGVFFFVWAANSAKNSRFGMSGYFSYKMGVFTPVLCKNDVRSKDRRLKSPLSG
jgi:hypothetical protein